MNSAEQMRKLTVMSLVNKITETHSKFLLDVQKDISKLAGTGRNIYIVECPVQIKDDFVLLFTLLNYNVERMRLNKISIQW